MKKSFKFFNLVVVAMAVAAPSFATADDVKLGVGIADPSAIDCKSEQVKKVAEESSDASTSAGDTAGSAK